MTTEWTKVAVAEREQTVVEEVNFSSTFGRVNVRGPDGGVNSFSSVDEQAVKRVRNSIMDCIR